MNFSNFLFFCILNINLDPGYQKIHIHREAGLEGQLNIETVDNEL